MHIKCQEIILATNGELISGDINTEFINISTDSRNIKNGDLFIPIVGDRFDGHDFVESSLKAGALGSLIANSSSGVEGKVIIKVENTLKALGDIAKYYRRKFKIPLVGITGSVGKTSTKDMIASVLNQKFNVLKTEGNFNNEIGLPLTIFRLADYHEAAVIEMGMSGFGEISRLTSYAQPDIAVITNIGLAHIEKLGSRQNILKAKMEILEGLNKDGIVILNGDDKLLYGLKGLLKFRTVFYGMDDNSVDYHASNVHSAGENGTYFEMNIKNKEYRIHIPVPGVHNVYNALAAIAAGIELNMPIDSIIRGIAEFSPSKMRLNIVKHNGVKIINDAYNASPQSMEAAIDVLKDLRSTGRTIAVLGDMLEMGEWAYKAHVDVGRCVAAKEIDCLLTVGENGRDIAFGAIESGMEQKNVLSFSNNSEVVEFLKGFTKDEDVILVKGSRGMKMEEIVSNLTLSK